jgi:Ca2+-binding RTX toxin-like protein
MPTSIIFDPAGDGANLIYGTDFGVSAVHDPAVNYDAVYYGLGGSDIIYDTDANGWIWARPGDTSAVFFYGQGGNDVLVGFDGNDWLDGGNGNDILIGNNGNDALTGGLDNDQLWGGPGGDQLNGGPGKDIVVGGGGGTLGSPGTPDVIAGGALDGARDILIGAVGSADHFVSSGNSQQDVSNGTGTRPFWPSTDIVWNFTVGEDVVRLVGQDGVLPAATYYPDWDGTGLSGTLIYSQGQNPNFPVALWPAIFFAGVNATYSELVTKGSVQIG